MESAIILKRNCCLLKSLFRGNKTHQNSVHESFPSGLKFYPYDYQFKCLQSHSKRSIAGTQSVIRNNLAVPNKGGSHVKDARLDFFEKIRMRILYLRFLMVVSTCTQIHFVFIGHQQEESTCRNAVLDESWTDSWWQMQWEDRYMV